MFDILQAISNVYVHNSISKNDTTITNIGMLHKINFISWTKYSHNKSDAFLASIFYICQIFRPENTFKIRISENNLTVGSTTALPPFPIIPVGTAIPTAALWRYRSGGPIGNRGPSRYLKTWCYVLPILHSYSHCYILQKKISVASSWIFHEV